MREIKFRGKSLKYGNWLFGSLWIDGEKCYIIHEKESEKAGENSWYDTSVTEVNPSTVEQYTGLKDKTGKDIYEGDILADNECAIGAVEITPRNGVVIKRRLGANFSVALRSFTYDSDFDIGQLSELKIIGNVYDNPELLKGGDK